MSRSRAAQPMFGLPAATSSFIGRQRELQAVRAAIGVTRLLTLTGPGGVGKTRLAVHSAESARRAFKDGVWLVDLAAVPSGEQLEEAVAAALGVPEQSTRSPRDQLLAHVAGRSMLVVLDNCEHLVEACAELVDDLLHRSPDLRVLATSRQPLRVDGERLFTVSPLAVPDPDEARAQDFESVALLVDRASAVRPGFAVDDGNRADLIRLCARLDGLPLAIELAAGKLRTLSVREVADRLDDRFHLLSGGNRTAMSRQQTLLALVGWSADLCSPAERTLWARLATFPADFDVAAVEAVCSGSGLRRSDLVGLLDDLVAKSIVNAQPDDSGARFRLLETIRAYGREVLAHDTAPGSLREAHLQHYLGLAESACAEWAGPRQGEILAELRREHANVTAALDAAVEADRVQDALRLAAALRYHWTLGGFLASGRRRLDRLLALDTAATRATGDALWVNAWIAALQGDTRAVAEGSRRCAAIAEDLGDVHLAGHAELLRGTGALFTDDLPTAVDALDAAIATLVELSETADVLWAQFQLSVALSHLGQHDRAEATCLEAISTADGLGETWARSEAMWARGFDHWLAGDPDGDAAQLVTEAIETTPGSNLVSTVLGLELLGWIAASRGGFHEAAASLEEAAVVWGDLGTSLDSFGPVFQRHAVRCRAAIAKALGDAPRSGPAERTRPTRSSGTSRQSSAVGRAAPSSRTGPMAVTLSPREREVALLIAAGLTNKAIASSLVLSPRTVDGHVERLFGKLDAHNRAQVAVWAQQHLVEPEDG